MANIKSAKKRIKVTAKKTLRNRMITSRVKTLVKKVVSAVAVSDNEAAKVALAPAVAAIDKAANKGVYHRKTASRKISRLTKSVNNLRNLFLFHIKTAAISSSVWWLFCFKC